MNEYEILRESVDGKKKYCRIPIRSKIAKQMQENHITELSAEEILSMPHDTAVRTIEAIIEDWSYWLKRANELFVKWAACQSLQEMENGRAKKGANE